MLEAAAQKSTEEPDSLKCALDTLGEELESSHAVSEAPSEHPSVKG